MTDRDPPKLWKPTVMPRKSKGSFTRGGRGSSDSLSGDHQAVVEGTELSAEEECPAEVGARDVDAGKIGALFWLRAVIFGSEKRNCYQ